MSCLAALQKAEYRLAASPSGCGKPVRYNSGIYAKLLPEIHRAWIF
jgi:hypothetical protein